MLRYSPEIIDLFCLPKWQQDWEMWVLRQMGEETDRQIFALLGISYQSASEPEPKVPPYGKGHNE